MSNKLFEECRKKGIHTISQIIHKEEARWYSLQKVTEKYVLSNSHYLQYFQFKSGILDSLRDLSGEIHQNK